MQLNVLLHNKLEAQWANLWTSQKQELPRGSCLLTDRDKINKMYRGPSKDALYHVSIHLAKQFQRRRFLEIDQPETRIAYGGHAC
jgi:hypothetical protein